MILHWERLYDFSWISDALNYSWMALHQTVWQHQSDVGGLNLQISLYSLLALFLKPLWHLVLHAEQQEIKLWSALVYWDDLLPHCYLIIQEPWNVLLYSRMQPQCLCLPFMTELPFMHEGFECVYCHSCHYILILFAQTQRNTLNILSRVHTQGFE